jgi:cysteine desulfurase/selenocysteine lyase
MTSDFDTAAERARTPGCRDGLIHLNSAGAGLMPQSVVDAQCDHIRLEAEIGGYEAHAARHDACEGVYDSVARLIGADADEIALVENATVAWQMAFYGFAQGLKPGDRILTAEAEYAANYIAYLQAAKATGAVIDVIPSRETGETDPDALAAMIDDRVKLVAVTHVPTNGGLVNPAAEIGRVCRDAGVFYLLDACQAVGQMPIDVDAVGCDALSATGRKYLRGPRGSGFLYMRRSRIETVEPPMLDMFSARWTAPDVYTVRPDARRFENWENNYAARLGLGAAVEHAMNLGLDAIEARIAVLADRLRAGLRAVPGVSVHDIGRRTCGIVTFTVDGADAGAVKAALSEKSINTSVSNPSSTLLDATRRGLADINRASVHVTNTEDEIDTALSAIEGIAASARRA